MLVPDFGLCSACCMCMLMHISHRESAMVSMMKIFGCSRPARKVRSPTSERGLAETDRQCLFQRQFAAAAAVHGLFSRDCGGRHAFCVMSDSCNLAVDGQFVRINRRNC